MKRQERFRRPEQKRDYVIFILYNYIYFYHYKYLFIIQIELHNVYANNETFNNRNMLIILAI